MKDKLIETVEKFKDCSVVVIGDIMLDIFRYGNASRINPEAPTLLLSSEKEEFHLGGAGNVASNVKSLGGRVSIFSFLGDDEYGETIRKLLEGAEIRYFFNKSPLTTSKERIIGNSGGVLHQIVRFDKEDKSPKFFSKDIKDKILDEITRADIVIISDYAKGAITSDLMDHLKKFSDKIVVDPKQKLEIYNRPFVITPNEKEALELTGAGDYCDAGKILLEKFGTNILITRGAHGMSLFSKEDLFEIPTYAQEVYDVLGAGDTVISALALSLAASKKDLKISAEIANRAAGIAVRKRGTYSVTKEDIIHELKINYD